MKARSPALFRSSFVLISVVGLAAHARAEAPAANAVRVVPVMTSSEFVVAGEVIARTELGFTLLVQGSQLTTIRIHRYTAITKGAETIQLADLMVGDQVKATLMRGSDGNLQAVNVVVRTGFEPRI